MFDLLLLVITTPLLVFGHPVQLNMHSSSLVKHPFSEDDELFSSKFKQPEPPLVHAEFTCNWKQHAWYAPSLLLLFSSPSTPCRHPRLVTKLSHTVDLSPWPLTPSQVSGLLSNRLRLPLPLALAGQSPRRRHL